jgi:hypothetical protein
VNKLKFQRSLRSVAEVGVPDDAISILANLIE